MTAEPIGRDYLAEMRAVIDAELQDGDSAPAVAGRIVAKLHATDPDLLAGWLDAGAVGWLTEAIGCIDRSARSHARAVSRRSAFGEASGDGDVAGFLVVRYVVDDAHTRKPLRELTRGELLYVAEAYAAGARAARFEAAFFRALAKRVGDGVVADHFTEAQIAELRRGITG